MMYPKEDATKWAERYGIDPTQVDCPKCKTVLDLKVPVAIKGYRGLQTMPCPKCGYDSLITRFVPAGEKIHFWNYILRGKNYD